MEKKMNNKGFSLVELIIVVAIMAVLIGVLAPTYLKYVESSKKTADCSAIGSVLDAFEVVAIDPATKWKSTAGADNDYKIVVTATGVRIDGSDTANVDNVRAQIAEIADLSSIDLQGKWADDTYDIMVEKDSNGKVTFKITNDSGTRAEMVTVSPVLANRIE